MYDTEKIAYLPVVGPPFRALQREQQQHKNPNTAPPMTMEKPKPNNGIVLFRLPAVAHTYTALYAVYVSALCVELLCVVSSQ